MPTPTGSSPRVRGTGAKAWRRRWWPRIIPAGAGNRATEALSASTPADHPRGCGEQRDAHDLRVFEPGSSPRVRGTGRGVGYRAGAARIIPAGAGNSATSALREESDPDHPRGCGEQAAQQPDQPGAAGSSPRVRGTVSHAGADVTLQRIIPAGAGNSRVRDECACAVADHPRGCGEQKRLEQRDLNRRGSSPRVRGTVGGDMSVRVRRRIIPAGAGNRESEIMQCSASADHPRGCGEQVDPAGMCSPRVGSSPRVRGTVSRYRLRAAPMRVIPAGAGNRWWGGRPSWACPGHPRGCGEQMSIP